MSSALDWENVQHSPPGERPNLHALLPAVLAAAYLSIPTGAEFIKALMRGIRAAASAEAAEPLGSVVQQNFTAPGEVRDCRPISERRNDALPAAKKDRAGKIDVLLCRGEANSVENISEGEGQSGTSDHRVLLRGTDIAASTMPAGCAGGAPREIRPVALDQATARVIGKPKRARVICEELSSDPNPKKVSGRYASPVFGIVEKGQLVSTENASGP
jgi:hypothetical protein